MVIKTGIHRQNTEQDHKGIRPDWGIGTFPHRKVISIHGREKPDLSEMYFIFLFCKTEFLKLTIEVSVIR